MKMSIENRKRNIAVVFTGGTIGSKIGDEGWIAPNREQPYLLLDLFQERYPNEAKELSFDCSMPYQILSEQLNADYLNLLIKEVAQLLERNVHDAILICHGTDTLQYSVAMLGLLFWNSKLPIYLVSSNFPLENPRANGLYNFLYAIKSISLHYTGVMVPYRNSDGNTYLHWGTKLLAHQAFEDNLFSIHQEVLGFYNRNGEWIQEEAGMKRKSANFPELYGISEPGNNKQEHFMHMMQLKQNTGSILWLRMYPGFQWSELPKETKYVILESYHSGTICIDEGLKRFLAHTAKYHIPVYVTGLERVTDSYETIQQYEELGLQPILNEAPIAIYCLLWLTISQL